MLASVDVEFFESTIRIGLPYVRVYRIEQGPSGKGRKWAYHLDE